MDIATLEQTVARAERALERRIGEANALVAQAQSAKQSAADSEAFVLVCDEAISFLNSFSDSRQEEVRAQVEGLVTHGLRTIFSDSDMSFHVNHEQRAPVRRCLFPCLPCWLGRGSPRRSWMLAGEASLVLWGF